MSITPQPKGSGFPPMITKGGIYEPYDDIFKAWTVDGEYFEFKVHYDKSIV